MTAHGWTISALTDVADVVMGQSPPGNTYNTDGVGLPFFQGKAEFGDDHPVVRKWCTAPTRIAEAGDILMSIRAPVGPTNVADQRCAVGRGLAVIRPKPGVPAGLVRHAIKLQEDEIASWGTGTTFTAISKRHFRDIRVPLPPEDARQNLTGLLDHTVGLRRRSVSHLVGARRAIERFRQALLSAACSGRLSEDWREASPDQRAMSEVLRDTESTLSTKRRRAITEFDASDLAELPSTWTWVSLAAVSDSVLGKMLDKTKNKGEPHPYLRNTNVRWRDFDLGDVSEMRFEAGEEERYGLEPGDVLVCEGGEPGRAAVWRDDESGMRFQKALHRVRCEEALLPDFLVNVLQAHASSGLLSAYFTGSGIAHLTGVSLTRVPVPLPPVEEQREIVCRVDRLLALASGLEQRVEVAATRVERSSQAVLAKAFRGDLIAPKANFPEFSADESAAEFDEGTARAAASTA